MELFRTGRHDWPCFLCVDHTNGKEQPRSGSEGDKRGRKKSTISYLWYQSIGASVQVRGEVVDSHAPAAKNQIKTWVQIICNRGKYHYQKEKKKIGSICILEPQVNNIVWLSKTIKTCARKPEYWDTLLSWKVETIRTRAQHIIM